MNPLHVHLFINHLPIAGTILGAVVLALALGLKSRHTEIAAYTVFILSSLGAAASYLTGEGAEHAIKEIPGIVKSTVELHENFSIYALIALIILGIASVGGIIQAQRKTKPPGKIAVSILCLSIICMGLIAWTAYLGGQIRHTELKGDSSAYTQPYRDPNLQRLP